MADAKPLAGTRRTMDVVPEFERILQYLKDDATDVKDRVYGYVQFQELVKLRDGDALNQRICANMRLFCSCIQRDIVSSNEDISSVALKVLGFLLQRKTFVTRLPDDEACKFLLTLLALITTTSKKTICSLGLWCLAVQEMKTSLVASHLKMIVAVLLHGIDNPLGSMVITYEAFQAVKQLARQLPEEMRNLSWTWAPPVYQKLLNSNTKIVELAESCLSGTQSVLLPPLPRLSEVVVTDLQHRLLSKMEEMIKLEGRSPCIAIQAWGWLVKLLGVVSTEEKSLINTMLKLLERSFGSPCAQVRSASQLAWVSVIDVFVPSEAEAGPNGSPRSLAEQSRGVQLSLKRLKLLLMPLLNTMSWEKDVMVQRSCCCTWIYLLCRLGQSVNEKPVFDAAVLPMLEVVFKLDKKNRDESVWQACVDLLTDAISCKGLHETSSDAETLRSSKGASQSPQTPGGITYTGVYSESHHRNIRWSSWCLDRLDPFIRLVLLLWTSGLQQPAEVKSEDGRPISLNENFEAARECWMLLVRGVEAEGRNTVRPSSDHVTAVHLLLKFLCGICADVPSKNLFSLVWSLMEILIDSFGRNVIASSFYRIRLQFTGHSDFLLETHGDCGPHSDTSLPDMVTPVVYISAAWFKLVFESSAVGLNDENVWFSPVEKLITAGRTGFDVMGNYLGFAWILHHLASESHLHREESPDMKRVPPGLSKSEQTVKNNNWHFLLEVWRIVAEKLRELVERSNDVSPVGGCQRDSGYQVVLDVLIFPIKCFLILSRRRKQSLKGELCGNSASGRESTQLDCSVGSEAELQTTEGGWFKLFESVLRVSSLKSPQPNSFIGGFFQRVMKVMKSSLQEQTQLLPGGTERTKFDSSSLSNPCLKFLGDIVAHAMKHAEISNLAMLAISRKRRKTGFGASSVRVQCIAGMELEDANNLKDLLTVAGRLLTLSYEKYKHDKKQSTVHDSVVRVLGALTSLMQHVTSQNDSILLLQAIAQPLSYWFTVDSARSRTDEPSRARRRLPGPVLDGLFQAWDGLLYCLQTCRPCLAFDSKLLLLQGSSLAPAFMHHHDAISNRTLAFWESTYGIKAAANLDYPLALVKVFNSLKQKVDISLPGWPTRPVVTTKEAQDVHDAPQRSYRPPHSKMRHFKEIIESKRNAVEKRGVLIRDDHQTASRGSEEMKFRPAAEQLSTLELGQQPVVDQPTAHSIQLIRDDHQPASRGSEEMKFCPAAEQLSTPEFGQQPVVDQPTTHSNQPSNNRARTEDQGDLQCSATDANDTSPEQESQFLPTPEGNALIDELVSVECASKFNPQEIFKSNSDPSAASNANVVPTDVPASASKEGGLVADAEDSQAVELPSMLEMTTLLQGTSAVQLNPAEKGPKKNETVQTRAMARAHDAAAAANQGTGKGTAAEKEGTEKGAAADLVTPPIPLTDIPSVPPKMAAGVERPQATINGGRLHVAVAAPDGIKGTRGAASNLPRRRKKLKFQEDSQEVEYIVIPQSQRKKAGPLTERQREVRLSQRTSGHVVKMYTLADFSQAAGDCANDLMDSQALDAAMETMDTIVCKENIPPSNVPSFPQCASGAALTVKAEGLACNVRKTDSRQVYDPVRIIPLDEVDYIQLKNKLTSLIRNDPTLTYREIFDQESYECLPRLIQARLGSHFIKFRKKITEEPTDVKNVDHPESKSADQQQHPQRVLGETPSEGKTVLRPGESRDAAAAQEQDSAVQIPPSRLQRRKPEPHGFSKGSAKSLLCVNLRSSGKLRGGKHWRVNSELGKVITARLGIKKIVAKRQLMCSSIRSRGRPRLVERPPASRGAALQNIVEADCSTKPWGKRLRACNKQEVEKRSSLYLPPQALVNSSSQLPEDSPVTFPECKEKGTGAQEEPQPVTNLKLASQLQENSPFQVRNLNRGLLASSFSTANKIADTSVQQQDSIQTACRSSRANSSHNPRKCRAPKRVPSPDNCLDSNPSQCRVAERSVSEEDDATTTSGARSESVGLRNSDALKVAPPSLLRKGDGANGCSSSETQQPPLLYVCLGGEGSPFQPSSGSVEVKDWNVRDCLLQNHSQPEPTLNAGPSREGSAGEDVTSGDEDFKTPAGFASGGRQSDAERCKLSEGLGAEGFGADRHSSQSQTEFDASPRESPADSEDKRVGEIKALLEREDVQVCNVLSALLASSKWKNMGLAEVSEVDELLCQLKEALARKGEASLFITPTNP